MSNENQSTAETLSLPVSKKQSWPQTKANDAMDIKTLTIYAIGCETLKKLQILRSLTDRPDEAAFVVELVHNLFTWSVEDLIERIEEDETNVTWIEILVSHVPPRSLAKFKILKDYDELKGFVRILLQTYLNEGNVESAWPQLLSAKALEGFYARVTSESLSNTAYLPELMLELNPITRPYRPDSTVKFTASKDLETEKNNSIRVRRYALKYNTANEEVFNYKTALKESNIQKEIDRYNKLIERETKRSKNVLFTFNELINQAKGRTAELQLKFAAKEEEIDDQLFLLRSDFTRMRDHRKYFEQLRVQHREEIRRMRLRDEKLARRRAEALALAAQPPKKRKLKSKVANAKKGAAKL